MRIVFSFVCCDNIEVTTATKSTSKRLLMLNGEKSCRFALPFSQVSKNKTKVTGNENDSTIETQTTTKTKKQVKRIIKISKILLDRVLYTIFHS